MLPLILNIDYKLEHHGLFWFLYVSLLFLLRLAQRF